MTSDEANNIIKRAICPPMKKKPRTTPAQRRRELADAQIAALERVAADIRNKARETPGWAKGYFSAITSIELEISAIRSGK